MEKSKAFHMAQLAVLNDPSITFEDTLAVLAILMHEEDLAKFTERKKEKSDGESV